MTRVVTILEAQVPPDRHDDLERAYRMAIAEQPPPGLVRSTLLRDARDLSLWRIETVWESREALSAMRGTGTPRGVQIFREAGVEPGLSVLNVVEELDPG